MKNIGSRLSLVMSTVVGYGDPVSTPHLLNCFGIGYVYVYGINDRLGFPSATGQIHTANVYSNGNPISHKRRHYVP